MKKPVVNYSEYCEAIDRVVMDIMHSMRLPEEITSAVANLKLEMARRQNDLPRVGKIILSILKTSLPADEKCKQIIWQAGEAAGVDKFSCGIYVGTFEARLKRYPDITVQLPAIIEKGRRELERLV